MSENEQTVSAVNLSKEAPRYCNQCGAPLVEGASFCGRCGSPVASRPGAGASGQNAYAPPAAQQAYGGSSYGAAPVPPPPPYGAQDPYNQQYPYQQPLNNDADQPSVGFNILAFLMPLIGLILYCVWQNQYPRKAKAIGQWALIGFIVGAICSIFLYAVMFFSMIPY